MLHFARQLLSLLRDLVVLRVAGDDADLIDRAEDERHKAALIAKGAPAERIQHDPLAT